MCLDITNLHQTGTIPVQSTTRIESLPFLLTVYSHTIILFSIVSQVATKLACVTWPNNTECKAYLSRPYASAAVILRDQRI